MLTNLPFKIFVLWLLLLPFSWLLNSYTGFIAPDKLFAPLLLLLGFAGLLRGDFSRQMRILFLVLMMCTLLLFNSISFINESDLFFGLLLDDAVRYGYFLIPVLLIKTMKDFRVASWMVVYIAVVGCISAILASTGLISLPIERFEVSRLGILGLPKSIGLFVSYGDMAQYLAFAVLWMLCLPGLEMKTAHKNIMRVLFFFVVVAGVLAAQSRNVAFSIVIAPMMYFYLFFLLGQKRGEINGVALIGSLVAIGIFSLFVVYIGDVLDVVRDLGGSYAQNTVNDRLSQYRMALDIMSHDLLFGANVEIYSRNAEVIDKIHNAWLRLGARGGLVAITIFAALLFMILSYIWKARWNEEKRQETRIVLSYMVVVLFSINMYPSLGELFWALLGIGAALPLVTTKKAGTPITDKRASVIYAKPVVSIKKRIV